MAGILDNPVGAAPVLQMDPMAGTGILSKGTIGAPSEPIAAGQGKWTPQNAIAAEAQKAGSFENFQKDFGLQLKHGMYWHWTNDPNFQINSELGPRDMSSMASGGMDKGKLMVTSDLDAWSNYGPGGQARPYVAQIDMRNVPREQYFQSNRGFGNEFFVNDPSLAKVVRVVTPQQARRIDRAYDKTKPQSDDELSDLYNSANAGR